MRVRAECTSAVSWSAFPSLSFCNVLLNFSRVLLSFSRMKLTTLGMELFPSLGPRRKPDNSIWDGAIHRLDTSVKRNVELSANIPLRNLQSVPRYRLRCVVLSYSRGSHRLLVRKGADGRQWRSHPTLTRPPLAQSPTGASDGSKQCPRWSQDY